MITLFKAIFRLIMSHALDKFTALEGFIFIAIAISAIILILNPDILNISWFIGLIWASVFGLMFGSFATSLVARIPKHIFYTKADPYCMSCKTPLRTRDLYTIFSYIINKGKCRFCNSKIPPILFYTETLVALTYIISYIYHGFSNIYVVSTAFWVSVIIFVAIYINDRFVSYVMIVSTVTLGAILYCVYN